MGYLSGCCLAMYSTTSGRKLWHKQLEKLNHEEFLYDLFLTDTFCGFMHTDCISMINISLQPRRGRFELTLYENCSGWEIGTKDCWNFDFPYRIDSGGDWKRVQPKLATNGRYIFACSTHGRCERNPKNDQENTLVCAKVDLERLTSTVQRTSTSLETVVLAKALLDQSNLATPVKQSSVSQNSYPTERAVFDYRTFEFLGFAFESVALIQVEYLCVTNNFRKCGKVVMSVDLDKILNMHEPASVFSAVHFPLDKNMFEEFNQVEPQQAKSAKFGDIHPLTEDKVEHFPFYQTLADEDGVDRVELAGFVEISDDDGESLRPKIHSFRVEVEFKELSS